VRLGDWLDTTGWIPLNWSGPEKELQGSCFRSVPPVRIVSQMNLIYDLSLFKYTVKIEWNLSGTEPGYNGNLPVGENVYSLEDSNLNVTWLQREKISVPCPCVVGRIHYIITSFVGLSGGIASVQIYGSCLCLVEIKTIIARISILDACSTELRPC
jgi:hypothetical protein